MFINAIYSVYQVKENGSVTISEFIPHFMTFLRIRLLQHNERKGSGNGPYFSPRQKEEQRKAERNKIRTQNKNNKTTPGGKSARLSLQYASSPLKPIKTRNDNHCNTNNGNKQLDQSEMEINGISPIKSVDHREKRGKSKQRRFNKTAPTKFELNSMDDFPSMASTKRGNTPSKSTKKYVYCLTYEVFALIQSAQ